MEAVGRALAIYVFLLIVLRLTGRRSLGQLTTFDFILLLIISEAVQNGMVSDDFSLTNAFVLVLTLTLVDIGLSYVKRYFPRVEHALEGRPLILLEDGRPYPDRLRKARVDEDDILAAARQHRGLERLDQIRFAVLERNGGISIIPKS